MKPSEWIGLLVSIVSMIAGIVGAWAAVAQLRHARGPGRRPAATGSRQVPPVAARGSRAGAVAGGTGLIVLGLGWVGIWYVTEGNWPLVDWGNWNLPIALVEILAGVALLTTRRRAGSG
ncbi:cell division protein CrgA [Amycolatopsis sp. NEAU-NG30]|uniref:Cell division protein CrgA n=1 Tax=Amycolatopsis melonis TaxID=3156488 RepID=A0ABV0LRL7_9PSEU